MSTDQILLGLGLVLVLAVASQLVAGRLGLPAIVVLLPAGFLAGIATDDVNPEDLLGALHQPFVSLAVGAVAVDRVAPDPEEPHLLPPSTEAGILESSALTFVELGRLFATGARVVSRGAEESAPPDHARTEVPLFAVSTEGRLSVAGEGRSLAPQRGDTVIVLECP